jgi:hypothetical protein
MRIVTGCLAAIILTFFFGCSKQETIPEKKQRALIQEIEQRLDAYPEALKRGDIEWFKDFWSGEADFAFASDGELVTDYAAFEKGTKEAIANTKQLLLFQLSNSRGHVISENAVSYATNFEWQIIGKSGDTLRAKGSWLYLFEKRDGEWRAVQSAGTHKYF